MFLLPEDARLGTGNSAVYPQAFGLMRMLADEIRVGSQGRVEVFVLDHLSSPVDIDQARRRLSRQPGEVLIMEAGEDRQVLRFRDLFLTSEATRDRPPILESHRLDEALATAGRRLGGAGLKTVALLANYRQGPANHPDSLRGMVQLLESEGYDAQLLEEFPSAESPIDLVLVPGQSLAMLPSDEAAAADWVSSGKPLLIGLGFSAPTEVVVFWNEILRLSGIQFQSGIVCQPWRGSTGTSQCDNQVELPPERLAPTHPITLDLRLAGRGMSWSGMRPLSIESSSLDSAREQLIWMGQNAWVETEALPDFQPGPTEQRGPFPVAIASQPWTPAGDHSGRILALGAVSSFFDPQLRDRDFLASCVRWSLGEDDRTSGLVALQSLPFQPTEKTRRSLANWAILTLPLGTLLLGLLVFLRRRR